MWCLVRFVLFLPVLIVLGLLGLIFRRRDIVVLPPDHPEMAAAIAAARRTLVEFFATVRHAPANTRDFCVKVQLPVEGGGHEHCWFGELSLTVDGLLSGVLNNEPDDVTTPKFGERVAIAAEDITDWGYFRGATAEGFFTTRALLPHVRGKIRARLLDQMGWNEALVGAPGFAVRASAPASSAPATVERELDVEVAAAARQFAREAHGARSRATEGGAAGTTVVAIAPPELPRPFDPSAERAPGVPPRRGYRTDLSKLSFAECRRFGHGWLKGTWYWLITRALQPAAPVFSLPLLQADSNATHAELAPAVHAQLDPRLAELEQHGFRVVRYQKLPEWFDGSKALRGGAVALAADGRTLATVNFVRNEQNPPERRDVVAVSLVVFLVDGGALGATTAAESFDLPPGHHGVVLPQADFATLQRALDGLVKQHGGRGLAQLDDSTVGEFLDRQDLATFRDRVERRKLWVPVDA